MSNENRKGPVTELAERMAQLEAVAKSSQQELMRAMADFDNFRRRVERDLEQQQRAAMERLMVDLLPVLDDFERAMRHTGEGTTQEAVERGIRLIHRQLCDILARHGLEGYSVCGQRFDPRRAEAIGYVHSDAHEPDTIVEEACRGYECRGRVIRPARVLVSKPKPAVKSENLDRQEDSKIAGTGEVV